MRQVAVHMLVASALVVGMAGGAKGADTNDVDRLKALSIDELMEVEVISAGKKPQPRDRTAAAIFVVTQEDIRRSGATTLVEALRMVPGVHVARGASDDWAVGIRGFTSRLSRSMLVLIDGRSVYTPLFAGVYWQVQDTLLEDVERIEVIRGPGGTLWGSNAVNGVVNVITKSAADTHGQLVVGGGGSEERGFGGARHGGVIGETLHYRLYGKGFERDAAFSRDTRDYDGWWMGQGGFRADWLPRGPDRVTFQGDYYGGEAGARAAVSTVAPPSIRVATRDVDLAGGNLLARWQHAFANGSESTLRAYYDYTHRRDVTFRENRNTFDVELTHRWPLGAHEIVWGGSYRVNSGRAETIPLLVVDPERRTNHLVSGFLQDEIRLFDDHVHLILGSKLEWNDYSGVELQPNGRLLWNVHPQHTLWTAVSRAVRTPSRVEQDLEADTLVDPTTPLFVRLVGDGRFKSETVLAYEAGYRVRPHPNVAIDAAAFYNDYDDLLSAELGTPFAETDGSSSRTIVPVFFRNRLQGDVVGFEVAVDARPLPWWRLAATYAYLQVDLARDPGSKDVTGPDVEGSSPHNQATLRSLVDLPYRLELDGALRYVDNLPTQDVDHYVELDLRLGWRATPNVEVSVVGQNLLANHHAEFGTEGGTPLEIQRGLYGKVTWRW